MHPSPQYLEKLCSWKCGKVRTAKKMVSRRPFFDEIDFFPEKGNTCIWYMSDVGQQRRAETD